MSEIVENAADVNEQIMKVLLYFEKCIDLKLINSKLTIGSDLIGELVNISDSEIKRETPRSGRVTFSQASERQLSISKPKMISYKLPMNTKNMDLMVLNNNNILKATEVATDDEFNFKINLQILNPAGNSFSIKRYHNFK